MSATEYAIYQAAVGRFLELNAVVPGCYGNVYDSNTGRPKQNEFSWASCDCCKRPLGGARELMCFATETGEQFEANVCTDCVYYLTYEELDAMTMQGIEADGPQIATLKRRDYERLNHCVFSDSEWQRIERSWQPDFVALPTRNGLELALFRMPNGAKHVVLKDDLQATWEAYCVWCAQESSQTLARVKEVVL